MAMPPGGRQHNVKRTMQMRLSTSSARGGGMAVTVTGPGRHGRRCSGHVWSILASSAASNCESGSATELSVQQHEAISPNRRHPCCYGTGMMSAQPEDVSWKFCSVLFCNRCSQGSWMPGSWSPSAGTPRHNPRRPAQALAAWANSRYMSPGLSQGPVGARGGQEAGEGGREAGEGGQEAGEGGKS
jgi:hypothetical protein